MNKVISVERLYSLGDYRNIKFVNTVTDIPEEVLSQPKAVELLWYLQLVEIEESRHRYDLLTRSILNTSHDEISEMLEDERMRTYEEFISLLDKKE